MAPQHIRKSRTPARRITLLLPFVFLAACSMGRPLRPQPAGEQDLILRAELERTRQQNLYDAIRHARPFWLTRDRRRTTSSDPEIVVYLDEQQLGGLAQLQRLPVTTALRVRYVSATEAQVRFGAMNGLRPAILIETRP